MCLQLHEARLRTILEPDVEVITIVVKPNLLTYFYRLGELHVLVSLLFGFARGQSEFVSPKLEWEDFRNAYGNMNIWPEDFFIDENMNLKAFTLRQLSKFNTSNVIFPTGEP